MFQQTAHTTYLAHLFLHSNEDSPDPAPDISNTETADNQLGNTAKNNVGILSVHNASDNGSSTYVSPEYATPYQQ